MGTLEGKGGQGAKHSIAQPYSAGGREGRGARSGAGKGEGRERAEGRALVTALVIGSSRLSRRQAPERQGTICVPALRCLPCAKGV